VLFPSSFHSIKGGLAFALLAATAPAALAQTADLSVTAEIQASCVLNGGSLDFGTYTSTAGTDTQGQGSFSYQCTNGTSIFLSLNGGQNEDDDTRAMVSGTDRLVYELYRDPARQEVWRSESDALSVGPTSAALETVQVYGLIPQGQTSPAGTYNDVVQITLTLDQ
jgi:spore coat protein U-like protein